MFDFLDEFSVLILERSSIRQDLLADWISGVTTKTVASPSELAAEFDSTVTVVCLPQALLEDEVDSIQRDILTYNPYCQLIGVLPRTSFVTPFEDQFDEILQRPIFKEEFQQTIKYRFISGVYSNLLSELYDLNTTLIALRRASDEDANNKQKQITAAESRYENLNTRLETLQQKLSHETVISILQTVERHNRYLKEPNQDENEGYSTSYRPRRCPSCKLPWGVNHRNDLGNGYTQFGADVFQCRRCNKHIHGLAGEQRVF